MCLAQWQQNDELNLALRTTLGAVAMRTLVENNREEIRIPVGLVVNQEKFYSSDSSLTSLEAVLGIDVAAFRFDSPKLDFSGSGQRLPQPDRGGPGQAQVGAQGQVRAVPRLLPGRSTLRFLRQRSAGVGCGEERRDDGVGDWVVI